MHGTRLGLLKPLRWRGLPTASVLPRATGWDRCQKTASPHWSKSEVSWGATLQTGLPARTALRRYFFRSPRKFSYVVQILADRSLHRPTRRVKQTQSKGEASRTPAGPLERRPGRAPNTSSQTAYAFSHTNTQRLGHALERTQQHDQPP